MNPKPLLKHFPELAHLPRDQQEALLREAHEDATGQRLETWRSNLFGVVLVSALCLGLIFWVGPALDLSRRNAALIIMLVVFPAASSCQQRRYISSLRTFVAQRFEGKVTEQAESTADM